MRFDTTLFIEYFITGGLAIIWLIPLINLIEIDSQILNLSSSTILVSISITYILGMLIDYLAAVIFRSRKVKVRNEMFDKFELKAHKFYEVLFIVNQFENELLLKHLERRNSRVRYARGALFNFILATIVLTIFQFIKSTEFNGIVTGIILMLITFLIWKMWEKMLALSYQYQSITIKHINDETLKIKEKKKEHSSEQ